MGRAWVVCLPRLRFVELRAGDDRDTRATTFSCCLCGREGRLVFDDPAKEGLQYDPRSRPLTAPGQDHLACNRSPGFMTRSGIGRPRAKIYLSATSRDTSRSRATG